LTLRLISDLSAGQPEPGYAAQGDVDPAVFAELFAHAGGMLAVLDAQSRFVAVNSACRRVLGHPPDSLLGQSLLDFAAPSAPSVALRRAFAGGRVERSDEDVVELLARHRHADGTWRWLLWSGAVYRDRWYASARDVTDWMRLEDRVGRDPLTQLPNREIFTDEVTHALARHERSGLCLAVLFIDIDSLKQINDSIGHDAGDRLVAHVAERLRLAVRTGDLVARLGGDEFGILVESLGDEVAADSVARRALAALEEPVALRERAVAASVSIGVSTSHGPPSTAAALIHEADIAMYEAKGAGRNRVAIYDAQLRAEVERRQAIERDLAIALERDQFSLAYEPIVSLEDQAEVGCEAVLRWEHPDRGFVALDEFLPLAEQNGQILQIGRWMLEAATLHAAARRVRTPELFVSIDVSARQLADDRFAADVSAALESSGLEPGGLCLEVAEAAIAADPSRISASIAELKALGVRIACDEFGSDRCSLANLTALPLDSIKLDRSFAAEPCDGEGVARSAVVAAVVAAARALAVDVVVSGVDRPEQLEPLRAAGCSRAQGSLFLDSPARPTRARRRATTAATAGRRKPAGRAATVRRRG